MKKIDHVPEYTKLFTRDFTLCIIELWWKAEAVNEKKWTEKTQPYLPYMIFEKGELGVLGFYDPRGIQWAKEELIAKARKDPSFIAKIEKEFKKGYEKIEKMTSRKEPLSKKELLDFLHDLEMCWVWFEAGWWLWEMTEEEKKRITIPASVYELREKTQGLVPESERVIRQSLKKLFPEIEEYIDVIKTSEIEAEKAPSIEILQARVKNYYVTDGKVFENATRQEIESRYKVRLESNEPLASAKTKNGGKNPKISSIKGQIGFSGKVVGTVKIVFNIKQMDKVTDGDILVAPMTLPDILPAMQKAAAFVTDEGGIMCHAAIIAREMKKPCIVGTKIATQVLHDGDTVEVDAEKGIVKILK